MGDKYDSLSLFVTVYTLVISAISPMIPIIASYKQQWVLPTTLIYLAIALIGILITVLWSRSISYVFKAIKEIWPKVVMAFLVGLFVTNAFYVFFLLQGSTILKLTVATLTILEFFLIMVFRRPLEALFQQKKNFHIEKWLPSNTLNPQNYDCYPLTIPIGRTIRKLHFKIHPPSTGPWRAGFKLLSPSTAVYPLPIFGSVLFHLGSLPNDATQVGVTLYVDGRALKLEDAFRPKNTDKIEMLINVNDKNYIDCFVDDVNHLSQKIDNDLLKRALLLVWEATNNPSVSITDIDYSLD